ncbi:unnamed protein product [Adineta steineri]|uniref:Uncharacterized protein n=1 Tax=Adineta steineri TaxID=433720 RepID=A0A819SB21_9BILA|nr:unnamed protein product [Adineta steineri]CAF4102439.1 unnamed protein product [Adineta steineri]
MVLKDDDISRCKTRVDAIGFDALSSYGIGGGGTVEDSPFRSLDGGILLFKVVEKLLTCTNTNVAEAQTVIVYAWNENSENGASLIPTIGNGTYYINALSEILPMSC